MRVTVRRVECAAVLLLGWWAVLACAEAWAARWEVADPGASDPNAIIFTDPQHGVVSAAAASGFVFDHTWTSPLRWTEDGGLTWNAATVDDQRIGNVSGLWFAGPRLGFAVGQHGWEAEAERVLLRTEDGGRSWRTVPLPTGLRPGPMWFFDEQVGWQIASRGPSPQAGFSLLTTSDAGRTWTPGTLPEGMRPGPLWFDKDGQRGWLGLHRTTDRGGSWQSVSPGSR